MQATDERLLLERAGACDEAALGELYDRYAGKIYSYIFYRVGDPDLAEDLTASVFIKVLDALKSAKGWQSSFSGWLYRIAHNAVVDYFRRQEQEKVLPLDEQIVAAFDDPVAAAERSLSAEAIRAALNTLTEEQQQVVIYKFIEGMSNLQVAKIMGKTEGAIKSLQYRALAALRRHLEGNSRK